MVNLKDIDLSAIAEKQHAEMMESMKKSKCLKVTYIDPQVERSLFTKFKTW